MTKPSTLLTKHRFAKAGMAAALAIGPIAFAGSAQAQVYFRPFVYSYERPAVEEPAPYGSYQSVARILAREGYRLVGPLGKRGDQVVATGVDSAGRRMRFFIDPFEGEVLQSRPIASAHAYEAPSEAGYSPSPGDAPSSPQSEPRVIPGLSEEALPSAEPRVGTEQRRNRSPHAKLTPQSQTAAEPPLPHAAAKSDPGSRRALTPPRPAAGRKPPAPSAPPTADAKAPSESAAPAPAGLAQPAAASAPAASAPIQPAAAAPAASQAATDGTQNAAVAQPATGEPTAPPAPASASSSPAIAPAASVTAAPAKPEAAAPNSKAQNGVGG